MMHLMVSSRHMLAKKTTSGIETLNEGLVTFALDNEDSDLCKPQQILSSTPRHSCQCQIPDVLPSPRNYGEDFEHVAYSANGDGDGKIRSLKKKHLGGNRGHRRSAPLDALQTDAICLGPTLTSSLAFKEPRNTSPMMPAKLSADDSTGKFAYISLDGRLVNANLATSVTAIGGKLRDEEERAWEDFVPMQLVWIVAVAAAVSAAAKHRKKSEIDRLLKTVENRVLRNREHCMSRILATIASFVNIIMSSLHTFFWALVTTLGISSLWTLRWAIVKGRLKLLPYVTCSQEKELISLSQELNEICKLNNTNSSHLLRDHPEPFPVSPKTPTSQMRVGRNFNGHNGNGNLDLQEGWSSTKCVTQTVVESSPDLFSITTSPVCGEVRTEEESKWYVNPLVEYSQDSDDSFSTPERCCSLFPPCNPAVQGSLERTVSRSSFGNGETGVSAGLPPPNISPSGSDSHLLIESQDASGCNGLSKIEENIVAWRQYLERNHGAEAVFEGDEEKSPNKLKLSDEEDVTDLAKQLQSKEVEIADLKKGRKILLEAKNREIEELKKVLKSRDAELEKLLAVVETSRTANADRLAILEELCRDKDSTIFDLKQDIQSLEWKVQKSRVYQSPPVLRGRRYSASFIHSSSSDHGASQTRRFSDKYNPSSVDPSSNHVLEHSGRFKKGVRNSTGHLPELNTQRLEDLADDGRSEHGYDQEPSLEDSFLLGSSVGDDCSVNSLVYSESEFDGRFGSEERGSLDGSRSKDHFSGKRGSLNNWTLHKHNSMSSDLRRATTSFTSSARSFTRIQSCKNTTSAKESTFKPLHRNLSGEMKKVIKNPNSTVSSPGSSPQTNSFKGLGSVVVQHFRSSSLDTNFKSNNPPTYETSGGYNGSSLSHKNSATKRKQWV